MPIRRSLNVPVVLALTLSACAESAPTDPGLSPDFAAVQSRYRITPPGGKQGGIVHIHDSDGGLVDGMRVWLSNYDRGPLTLTVNNNGRLGRLQLPDPLLCGTQQVRIPDGQGGRTYVGDYDVTLETARVVSVMPDVLVSGQHFTIYDPKGRFQVGDRPYFSLFVTGICIDPQFITPGVDLEVSPDGTTITGTTTYIPPAEYQGLIYVAPHASGPFRMDPIPVTYGPLTGN